MDIEQEIIILKEAVAGISNENKKLHEWTNRALYIDNAIKHGNLKRLREIKRYMNWIYKKIKSVDFEDYGRVKKEMKKIKEHLSKINLY